jgi:hypothetical protein
MGFIAKRPSQELIDIVASLKGQWHGHYAMCRCPAHADDDPSLSLRQGDRGIIVHCFAGCSPHDVLREIAALPKTVGAPAPSYRPNRNIGNVHKLWEQGRPVRGTLAEAYLRLRSLPLELPDIRFHPRCPHKPHPFTEFKPALLVAVREGHQIVAITRIFLDPHTGNRTGKFMLGLPGKGAWKPRPLDSAHLALAEGFEDAAAYTRLNGVTCWATFTAERLHQITIPETVRRLIIAEDNNAPGRHGALRALKAYRRPGLEIVRHSPKPHKDWAEANMVA